MIWLILGAILLLVVYFGLQWLANTDPKEVRRVGIKVGALLLLLIALFLIFTGRAVAAWPFLLGAFGLYMRVRQAMGVWTFFRRIFQGRQPSPNQQSHVSTPYLHMTLNHEDATLVGKIVKGIFAGAALSDLSESQCVEKLSELYSVDHEGSRLLESYLDRRFPNWRERSGEGSSAGKKQSGSGFSEAMSKKEALDILGLEEGAGEAQIRNAHKTLMRRFHPDTGGTSYLASKINQAKELLLKE